jgi:hypothetical protein
MTSKNAKRVAAVVATLTTSLMIGPAAFAASPSAVAGQAGDTTAVVDHPIGDPYALVVNAITEAGVTSRPDTAAPTADDNPLAILGQAYAAVVNAITGAGVTR